MRWLRRAAAPALGLAILVHGGAASGQPSRCRVALHIEPERPYVGQEVLWRLRILHPAGLPATLDPQPSFPDFRAEWIPPQQREDPLTGMRIEEERRALFPGVAGRLELPAAGLRCGAADEAARVLVPSRVLEVRAAPRSGRPPDWRGLVGPVELSVLVTDRSLAVGQSLRVSVEIRGAANVWDAASPLTGTAGDTDAEIFPHPPQLARDTGERLVLRRYFSYDVVPRRPGRLEIPALRVPWLDPDTGRYRVVRDGPYAIRVLPASAGGRPGRPPRHEPALPAPARAGRAGWIPIAVAAGLVLLAGAGVLPLVLRRRGGPRSVRRAARSRLPSVLERARALESRGDVSGAAAVLARGLREVLTHGHPQAPALSAEEILDAARNAAERDLAALLGAAERLRFAGDSRDAELRDLLERADEAVGADGCGASR